MHQSIILTSWGSLCSTTKIHCKPATLSMPDLAAKASDDGDCSIRLDHTVDINNAKPEVLCRRVEGFRDNARHRGKVAGSERGQEGTPDPCGELLSSAGSCTCRLILASTTRPSAAKQKARAMNLCETVICFYWLTFGTMNFAARPWVTC